MAQHTLTLDGDELVHLAALVEIDLDAAEDADRVEPGRSIQEKIRALPDEGDRQILIHLNVTPPKGDERSADAIANPILVHLFGVKVSGRLDADYDVTLDGGTRICVPLIDEV